MTTLTLLKQLLREPSITPHDGQCQNIIAERLSALGCRVERMDAEGVSNLWVTHGSGAPVIAFAGHTDVVPTGDENLWRFPPFEPTEADGFLFARGAVDMKTGVAAAVTAVETLIREQPEHQGTLALLITSDEEGDAEFGTQEVLKRLAAAGTKIDYCIVAEPSAREYLGDNARRGRRGSISLCLEIQGKQGHVAYPANIINPIHAAARAVAALSTEVWDEGNAHFPPSSFQVSNIHSGTGADNVVPQSALIQANWRFNTEHTVESLKQRAEALIEAVIAPAEALYSWRVSGLPFVTENAVLEAAIVAACEKHTGLTPNFDCSGGTSDARFIAPYGTAVMELGVCSRSLHQINENVRISEVETSSQIYADVVRYLWEKGR